MSPPKKPRLTEGDLIEQTHATPPADRWRWRLTKRKILGSGRGNRFAAHMPRMQPEPVPIPVMDDSHQARVLRVMAALQRRQRGQALVEMTLVLGIFLSLVVFLVGIGQFLLVNYTVTQAARAAAHQAALAGGNSDAARNAADLVLMSGVGTSPSKAQVTIACQRSVCRRYDPITITVAYADSFWVPIPGFPEHFVVRAQAVRASERDQQP